MNRRRSSPSRPAAAARTKPDGSLILFEDGRSYRLVYLVYGGDCPAKEFIEELDKPRRAKMVSLLNRTANDGLPRNSQRFKPVEGTKLHEFKHFQDRILCHLDGSTIVLLCGVTKKKDKLSDGDIGRAVRLRDYYEQL